MEILQKKHRKHTIRKKLLLFSVFIVVFCIIASIAASAWRMSVAIQQNAFENSRLLAEKTIENVDYYLQNMSLFARSIASDDTILSYIKRFDSQGQIREDQAQLNQAVKKYQFLASYITDITILNEKTGMVYTLEYDYKIGFMDKNWFLRYQSLGVAEYFTPIHMSVIRRTGTSEDKAFSYIKKIYDIADPQKYLGTIVIEASERILMRALDQISTLGLTSEYLWTQDNELVIPPQDNDQTFENVLQLKQTMPDNRIISINGHLAYYTAASSQSSRWTLLMVTDYATLQREINRSILFLIGFGSTLLLASLIVSVLFSRTITRPIDTITQGARQVAEGDLNVVLNVNSRDETAELADVFMMMLENIRNLLRLNREKERNKRKAELAALQSQINPHFLYNTLDSLNWSAIRKKDQELSKTLTSLGKFFRISLSKGNEFIPVAKEFEHVQSYMDIEQFRKSCHFTYEINCDPSLASFGVLKLILQPAVENALLHGLRNKNNEGKITICLVRQGDNLLFTVTDNGLGMAPGLVDELNKQMRIPMSESPSSAYGIRNVNDRIRLYYGDEYGIRFESQENVYTTVFICFPAEKVL